VIFDSFLGKSYSCNPRYIYDYMKNSEEFKDWTFIWVKNRKKRVCPECKNVKYGHPKYYYYVAKSKYWVFNSRMPAMLKKKPSQVYLQTWHGTPLKKLAHDIDVGDNATFYRTQVSYKEMTDLYDADVEKYDYMISPNPYSTECFQTAFQIDRKRLIETGYPRNDVLVNHTEDDVEAIKERLGLPRDKKIILYAPTWRDNIYNTKGYEFEPKADFFKWKEKLGDEYFLIYKPHYLIVNKIDAEEISDFMYCSRATDNINDLYLVSDILITDYSSVFFDYAGLRRPILFYMFDIDTYANELRGFYFHIDELPGPIVREEDELLERIKHIDATEAESSEKYSAFIEKYCGLEDGKASERVVDIVFRKRNIPEANR
jgi:CDP-glycerol glycerophosphotransferase